MSEEKRMLGNYEVVNSIYIGDKEVVFGVDKSDKYPFLVSYCDYHNPFGVPWATESVGCDDYLEAMGIFIQRVQSQIEQTKSELSKFAFDNTVFTKDHCIPDKRSSSIVGKVVVIIAHMNKAKDTSPLYRTNGSIDIAGAARSILAVTRTANKQNPAERYLVQVKSNLAPMGSAILFEVADKGVNFLDELELSAEDAFSASAPRMGRPNAREEAATDFIRSLLAGGRRLASDCEAKLEAAGFKKSTYKKSKKKAGVCSVKDGFLWYWTLPEVEKPIENGQEVTDEDDLPV